MANRTDLEWSLDRFNRFIDRFVKSTGISGPLVVRRYATMALSKIVARTPVDTGVARAGWSAAGEALGVPVPPPGPRANAANIDLGEYEEHMEGERLFIRFANNVHYILPLEYGWSRQAPLGMVRITLAELRSGEDIGNEMMAELQDAWEETHGRGRFRAQSRIMRGVLGAVKDMPMEPRRPKPDVRRRGR